MRDCPVLSRPMADHYAKLWASILDSSVWSEPEGHRIVWITMLAMKDKDGFVGASVDGLARRANIDEERVQAALDAFLAPDPRSRNRNNEGRRIQVVPRGWLVLNHEYFQGLQDHEARRAYERNRKALQRRRESPGHVPDSWGHQETKCHLSYSVAVPVPVDVPEEESTPRAKRLATNPEFDRFWLAYDKKVGRAASERAWKRARIDDRLFPVILEATKAYVAATPDKAFRRHPATWLNQRGWEDEIVQPGTSGRSSTSKCVVPKDLSKEDWGESGPI